MLDLIGAGTEDLTLIELGLQHEQQHQELLLTDILHASPAIRCCRPANQPHRPPRSATRQCRWPGWHTRAAPPPSATPPRFRLRQRSPAPHCAAAAFRDRQPPRQLRRVCRLHRRRRLSARRPLAVRRLGARAGPGWQHPAYWLAPGDPRAPADAWQVFGLHGVQPLDRHAPVMQLSFYEAAAFAEWAGLHWPGSRLPTEFEWKRHALARLRPMQRPGLAMDPLRLSPLPRFKPMVGAVGEYNGKFMVGQLVLRGGSLATPRRPRAAELPQLLPAGRPLAVQRPSPGEMRPLVKEYLAGPPRGRRCLPDRPASTSPWRPAWERPGARPETHGFADAKWIDNS